MIVCPKLLFGQIIIGILQHFLRHIRKLHIARFLPVDGIYFIDQFLADRERSVILMGRLLKILVFCYLIRIL